MAVIEVETLSGAELAGHPPRFVLKSLYLGAAAVLGSLMMIDLIMIVAVLSSLVAYDPTGTVSAATILGRLVLLVVAMNVLFWFRHRIKTNVAGLDALPR